MLIKTKDLVPGMLLGRDLESGGSLVLRKGAVLSRAMIGVIRKRGIAHVDVEDAGVYSMPPQGPQVLKLAGAAYDQFLEKKQILEKLFADIDPGDGQMQLLKYCIMGQFEESFDNEQG